MQRDESVYNHKFLDDISLDFPKHCWSLTKDSTETVANLRNNLWPGFYAFHRVNTPVFGAVYIGNGVRNNDLPFMVWQHYWLLISFNNYIHFISPLTLVSSWHVFLASLALLSPHTCCKSVDRCCIYSQNALLTRCCGTRFAVFLLLWSRMVYPIELVRALQIAVVLPSRQEWSFDWTRGITLLKISARPESAACSFPQDHGRSRGSERYRVISYYLPRDVTSLEVCRRCGSWGIHSWSFSS